MGMTKSQRTRHRIISAAAHVLAKNGYGSTRLEDIASAAGIKPGSLYYHFSSREELVAEVLEVAIGRVSNAVKLRLQTLPKGASYRDRIGAAIETQLVMGLQQDEYTAASFRVTASLPPALRQHQIEMQREFGTLWRNLLVGARRAGEIDSRYDLSVLRMLLLGSINWSIDWYRSGALSPIEIAAQLTAMFFDGVSPRTPASALAGGNGRAKPARKRSTAAASAAASTRKLRAVTAAR